MKQGYINSVISVFGYQTDYPQITRKIKNYKARWGSCSAKGDIGYNWKIVIAPRKIVDYVVFHELSHLLQHDHSERFWGQVEKYVPDYRECRSWLKKNGPGLFI